VKVDVKGVLVDLPRELAPRSRWFFGDVPSLFGRHSIFSLSVVESLPEVRLLGLT